jgi:transposase-like protein
MSQNRRKFSLQFKAEAVQFVIQTGRPINEIAKEPEIHEGTLGHWVKQWKDENPEPETALTPMERVRVVEMEDEMRRVSREWNCGSSHESYRGD